MDAIKDLNPHHGITILVDEKPVGPFYIDEVTGKEIKEKAEIPVEYGLLAKIDGKLVPIGNDEVIKIHEQERFETVPPTPKS